MSMVINESLNSREVKEGKRMVNLIIPENMDVYVSHVVLHHDPQLWGDDVHIFKPERCAEEAAKATKK